VSDENPGVGTCAGTDHEHRAVASLRAADWLGLAATPTFAIMALMTVVVSGAPMDMLSTEGHGASSLSDMTAMYVLMAVFHAGSWLRLIERS
jgi:hypothetical protein